MTKTKPYKKKAENMYRAIALLIPRIEEVLNYDISYYEQTILIKKHIDNWREK